MTSPEWLVVIGPDGTVIAATGGVPTTWLNAHLPTLADAPENVRTTAATLAAQVRDPKRRSTVERARLEPPASGHTPIELIAIEAVAMRRTEVHLKTVLASTLEVLRRQADALEISLSISEESPLPERIAIDPEKIAWAVSSLVGSALRHVRRGTRVRPGGSIDVRLNYDEPSGEVIISVKDDGPGIPPDKLPWLFARKPGSEVAAGIGLMLVRDVVAAHGGTVTIESKNDPQDHGTTVVLRLPAR